MAANTCKKPEWLKQRVCDNKIYNDVRNMMKELKLHTVCENANCPNIGECFGHRTATFLILGGICTRACKYCAVPKGRPEFLDKEEPEKLAAAVVRLGLKHVVITSVTRDDLPDGGAAQFAECIKMVRLYAEKTSIEVLVPDFKGSKKAWIRFLTVSLKFLITILKQWNDFSLQCVLWAAITNHFACCSTRPIM